MLSPLGVANNAWKNERFSVFAFKPLHLLHPEISKKENESAVCYIAATEKNTVCTKNKKSKRATSRESLLLNECSGLFWPFKKGFPIR